jgi:hypothetical protein
MGAATPLNRTVVPPDSVLTKPALFSVRPANWAGPIAEPNNTTISPGDTTAEA